MSAGIHHATRLGLTGGIGSGKSTVSQMLVALGAHLVDTDAVQVAGVVDALADQR